MTRPIPVFEVNKAGKRAVPQFEGLAQGLAEDDLRGR